MTLEEFKEKTYLVKIKYCKQIAQYYNFDIDTSLSDKEFVEKVEKESSAPVISKAQVNEEQAENIVADEVDVVEDEEEYEEIVIPSESELKRMKKNQINELAKDFEFVVKMTDTKAKMIEDFLSQVDEYITELQESGEFVSATTEIK